MFFDILYKAFQIARVVPANVVQVLNDNQDLVSYKAHNFTKLTSPSCGSKSSNNM